MIFIDLVVLNSIVRILLHFILDHTFIGRLDQHFSVVSAGEDELKTKYSSSTIKTGQENSLAITTCKWYCR